MIRTAKKTMSEALQFLVMGALLVMVVMGMVVWALIVIVRDNDESRPTLRPRPRPRNKSKTHTRLLLLSIFVIGMGLAWLHLETQERHHKYELVNAKVQAYEAGHQEGRCAAILSWADRGSTPMRDLYESTCWEYAQLQAHHD